MKKILNLQAMRAGRAEKLPIIVDQNGNEHVVGGVKVADYMTMIALQEEFKNIQTTDNVSQENQQGIIAAVKKLILAVVPGFPVEDLYIDELFAVANSIQEGVSGNQSDSTGDSPKEP